MLKINRIVRWSRANSRKNQVGEIGSETIIGASVDANRPTLGFTDGQRVFFDQVDGSDSNGGTRASPKKTPQAAWALVDYISKHSAVQLDDTDLKAGIIEEAVETDLGISVGIEAGTWIGGKTMPSISGSRTGVAYGNGAWIYISTGPTNSIKRSTDNGDSWTNITNSAGWVGASADIIFADGQFVIVAGFNQIQTSPDGLTWTRHLGDTTPQGLGSTFSGVAYSGTRYLAAGRISGSIGMHQWSDDGITWNIVISSHGVNAKISYGNGIFLIVGSSNVAATSTDGINLTSRTHLFTDFKPARSIAFGNGIFVIVGGGVNFNELQITSDGISYTMISSGGLSGQLNDVVFAGNLFWVAGAFIAFSSDGINWTEDTTSQATGTINVIGFGAGTLLTDGADVIQTKTSDVQVNGDILGYKLEGQSVSTSKLIKNCTINGGSYTVSDGFKLENCNGSNNTFDGTLTVLLEIIKCSLLETAIKITNTDFIKILNSRIQFLGITIELTTDKILLFDNLIIGLLKVVGTPPIPNPQYDINQNTIIGDVVLDNAGGIGVERFRDNIVEGDVTVTATFEIESGNISGNVTGATLNPIVSGTDPLFKDLIDYELRRLSEGAFSDSPLLGNTELGKSIFHTYDHNGSPFPRDLGAYNMDNESQTVIFLAGRALPLPKNGGITHETIPAFNLNIPKSANPQQVNRPDERIEVLEISYKGTVPPTVSQFIEELESLTGLTVFLNMNQQTIPLNTFMLDGIANAGVFVINIDPADIPIGTRFQWDGIDYWIINRDTFSPDNATVLVLSRKLNKTIPDTETITGYDSPGEGEFEYVQQRPKKLIQDLSHRSETRSGLKLRFIRKKP